jgi:Leu/Phe-tRNA-protein transferase
MLKDFAIAWSGGSWHTVNLSEPLFSVCSTAKLQYKNLKSYIFLLNNTMTTTIIYIRPEDLSPEILFTHIYPNLDQDFYWSDCWTVEFYTALARAGFITIADKDHSVLIAEMHAYYSVLDWNDLHLSRHIKKIARSRWLADNDICLTVEKDTSTVIKGIQKAYGAQCWLIKPYADLLKNIETYQNDGFSFVSIELRRGRHTALLGGELGYTIGATYTSLSGFLDRDNPESNNLGTVQLVALGRLLAQSGYAFWNLGQPSMQYKTSLGAKTTPRTAFLQRYLPACGQSPSVPLVQNAGLRFSCQELIGNPAAAGGRGIKDFRE